MEYCLAHGDPNSLVTVPQAIVKVIFYVGGQKGDVTADGSVRQLETGSL